MTGPPLWLEQEASDVPTDRTWLGPAEHEHLDSLTVERRRQDWLLGRWTAKQVLIWTSALEASVVDDPRLLEILPVTDGSPQASISGVALPIALSLSHRAGRAFCCVWAGGKVGCDLELVEPRSPAFCQDYFTADEQAAIAGDRSEGLTVTANRLWSAKESVLKLLKVGLTVDSRLLEVRGVTPTLTSDWQRFTVTHRERSQSFFGWWCRREEWILTVATELETDPPIRLAMREEAG